MAGLQHLDGSSKFAFPQRKFSVGLAIPSGPQRIPVLSARVLGDLRQDISRINGSLINYH
jgi:hypothetical protein